MGRNALDSFSERASSSEGATSRSNEQPSNARLPLEERFVATHSHGYYLASHMAREAAHGRCGCFSNPDEIDGRGLGLAGFFVRVGHWGLRHE